MARTLKIAVIQMDVTPAPREVRLNRAGLLVEEAAASGAELVLLPELFNSGYAYDQSNYQRMETMTGPTVVWMRDTAARLGVYLAGSFLLLDGTDSYNALLLVTPQRRAWRYDKKHPWAWERAYFVDGDSPTIATTDLGNIGLMVCADITRPEAWKAYAGQVDLLLVASSPPDAGQAVLTFPSGETISLTELNAGISSVKDASRKAFSGWLSQNARWLGVPVAGSSTSGQFRSYLPNGTLTSLALLPGAPQIAAQLIDANNVRIEAPMLEACQIIGPDGHVLANRDPAEGEGFALAEVTLPGLRPAPAGRAPSLPGDLKAGNLLSDILALLSIPSYRHGLRRAQGARMAPLHPKTKKRLGFLALGAFTGLLLTAFLRRRHCC